MNKAVVFVVVVLLCTFGWITLRHSGTKPALVSGTAPDFSLTDLSNRPLSLSALRGKVVVLDFWATWCGPCREEIPNFVDLQNRYGDRIQVVGISMDDDEKPVREFQKQFKMNYPVAMGDPKLADAYGGILGLPITFVIDGGGRILARHLGATDVSTIESEVRKID